MTARAARQQLVAAAIAGADDCAELVEDTRVILAKAAELRCMPLLADALFATLVSHRTPTEAIRLTETEPAPTEPPRGAV